MIKKRGKTTNSSKKPNKRDNKHSNNKHPIQSIELIIKKNILGDSPEEYHFIIADQRKIKNLFELVDALETMSEEIFRHHANEFKNDFSTWVKDVFNDLSLSEDIGRAQSRFETQIAILRRLVKELLNKTNIK